MPCLNEAETLGTCIGKAQRALREANIAGEIVIADNGSSDGSIEIAEGMGARVVRVPAKGYGNALMGGIAAARGKYVMMGDADDSYDFGHAPRFVEELRKGADIVMGNRFRGGIQKNAMPPLHRYFGNPALTKLGQIFFRSPVGDLLRLARVPQGCVRTHGTANDRDGVCYRDGSQGHAASDAHRRSAHYTFTRWPQSSSASAYLA
jgi:glycosyltransferase involved in cell wall biosynthesis